jgi:hypothetical protein
LGATLAETTPELFVVQEMGEDALRVLKDYRKLHERICTEVKDELPQIRSAALWAKRL